MSRKTAKKKRKKKKIGFPKMPALSNYTSPYNCHKGNVELFSLEEENTGKFFCGGWFRDALTPANTLVIDLTGSESLASDILTEDPIAKKAFAKTLAAGKPKTSSGILQLFIPDGGTPRWNKKVWTILAKEVLTILKSGKDILICCRGGHGRTGIAAAILGSLIDPEMAGTNPIQWVRDIYCEDVVENQKQIDYIHEVLGLPPAPADLKGSRTTFLSYKKNAGTKTASPSGKLCPECGNQYYCTADCKTITNKRYNTKAPAAPELTDAEFNVIEYGSSNLLSHTESEWAKRFGQSW